MAQLAARYKPDSGYRLSQNWPPVMRERGQTEETFTVEVPALAVGATFDFSRQLQASVMYGVSVSYAGLSGQQQVQTELFGSYQQQSRMYYGVGTAGNNWTDAFQQWRYRDYEGFRELRGRVTNTGTVALPASTLTIVGEPF